MIANERVQSIWIDGRRRDREAEPGDKLIDDLCGNASSPQRTQREKARIVPIAEKRGSSLSKREEKKMFSYRTTPVSINLRIFRFDVIVYETDSRPYSH